MAITKYDIIRGPVISSKAYQLNQKLKKLMIYVDPRATKKGIKDALEKLFNVKVAKVNTLSTGSKTRRVGQRMVVKPGKRKAIITLAEGYSLDFFNQGGSTDVAVSQVATPNAETK